MKAVHGRETSFTWKVKENVFRWNRFQHFVRILNANVSNIELWNMKLDWPFRISWTVFEGTGSFSGALHGRKLRFHWKVLKGDVRRNRFFNILNAFLNFILPVNWLKNLIFRPPRPTKTKLTLPNPVEQFSGYTKISWGCRETNKTSCTLKNCSTQSSGLSIPKRTALFETNCKIVSEINFKPNTNTDTREIKNVNQKN